MSEPADPDGRAVEPPYPDAPAVEPDASSAGGTAGAARLRAAAEAASTGGPGGRDPDPPWEEGEPAPDRGARLTDVVRWRLPPRTAVVALAALALVGGAVAVRAAAQPTGDPVAIEEPAVTADAPVGDAVGDAAGTAAAPGPTPAEQATVWVHVVGRVASPGVVALPAGSRVGDAVTAAGGALPDADLAGLNLAAVVQDGAQVRVPAPGEESVAVADAGDPGASGAGAADGLVDVNAAGSAELQSLPGIGPVLADRIVAWRTEHGPFDSVDALLDVSGIGPSVLGQIRALVRV